VLPESLPTEKRSKTLGKVRGPQFSVIWKALIGPLGFLFFLAFLVNFALAHFEGIFGLYADRRYGYDAGQVGSILMVIGIVSSLVQMLLTGPATRKLGEPLVIKLSLAASAVGFVLMILAQGHAAVVVSVGFFVFANAMLRPAIMSLLSKLSRSGQGMAMGLNNSFQSLGRVVGPLWAGSTFDINYTLPYMSGAVIMVLSFFFSLARMSAGQMEEVSAAPLPATAAED
jgi:DHA1 family multidrug resistance protein-like MFS transporter